jgi:predicted enzyme related to lactoylglutathione lyase
MTSRLVALCFDANDPLQLARFYAAALRWKFADDHDDEVVTIEPTDETSFRLDFALAPNEPWGLNRSHLDLTTTSLEDQSETVEQLLQLGGSHLDVGQSPDDTHVVLADPEGNALCLIEPTNHFLRTCPRMGAVSCDGTREVGYFWSAALGWPLVWDQDDETAIRAPDGTGPMITWGGYVNPKLGKNRLHFDVAPPAGEDHEAEVERLIALGARRIDIGQGDAPWVVMADPDDNEFCVLTPRD